MSEQSAENDALLATEGHVCLSDASTPQPHKCSCGGWFNTCYQHEPDVIPPTKGEVG